MHRRPLRRDRFARAPKTCLLSSGLIAILLGGGGCIQWSYERIQIGQSPQSYDRVLPAEGTLRTELGLTYVGREQPGRTDAIVVLLTSDRRVAGKFAATRYERDWGFKKESGYRLRGELDLRMANLEAVGAIDALRALIDDMTAYQGEKRARDAYAWVAAGLVRIMQRWPGTGDASAATAKLTEALENVPGGGAAQIGVDPRGLQHFDYQQGIVR